MSKTAVIIGLSLVVGLIAVPGHAVELRVTGLFDNKLGEFKKNWSVIDRDLTDNSDEAFFGRTRSRLFFNFIASDDLRGVFALEIDAPFGAPSRSLSGQCIQGSGVFQFEQCGFRNGIDINNFELKHLYVDFRIPQLPIGNRWRIGGIPADVTPLHPHLLFTMDSGGGSLQLNFTPEVSLLAHYIQLEEDLDRFPGSTKLGEDYLTGGTLMLKPLPGLDLHLIGLYGHLQQPFGPSLTGSIGPFIADQGATINVTTESRYYLGFDARYRLGNLTLEPTFIYLLGERNFTSASAARTGVNDTDFRAFETQLVLRYTLGSWLLRGKFAYATGNKATDDVNNQGNPGTRRANVKRFFPMGVDGFHRFGEWFEVLGRQESSVLGDLLGVSPGDAGGFDRFGLIVAGVSPEYQATDKLVLEGAVGAFWTVEKTACPASLRTGRGGACAGPLTGTASTPERRQVFDFTGNSRFLGWEVDVGLRYTIMPGLLAQLRLGYAFLGDAFEIANRNVQDAWIISPRLLFTF